MRQITRQVDRIGRRPHIVNGADVISGLRHCRELTVVGIIADRISIIDKIGEIA